MFFSKKQIKFPLFSYYYHRSLVKRIRQNPILHPHLSQLHPSFDQFHHLQYSHLDFSLHIWIHPFQSFLHHLYRKLKKLLLIFFLCLIRLIFNLSNLKTLWNLFRHSHLHQPHLSYHLVLNQWGFTLRLS